MPDLADTIRVLVATDNHVGYCEDDPIRGDDSWRTFEEILSLARTQDVDMVLLAGDLFHDNKPSRKAMYHVMESLRRNCLGDKPCSLEMLSDQSEHFSGSFNHVNYQDPDINVGIPVFSIHGNHDDPSGDGHFAALDLLQMSGLLNYYGRIPESDNIHVKPVLLQKGTTKLAMYGLSNVRDERLFRTFRDGQVKFSRPKTARDDWYNLLSVHQNHVSHTETGWLPESFLPDFMDLVVWGHEHECRIDPRTNPETGFKVMQPGSSVATSLVPSEAEPKHVAILNITGKSCRVETIRLKTVRPFIYRDVTLNQDKHMRDIAMKADNLPQVKKYCKALVDGMIEEANRNWLETAQELGEDPDEDVVPPLPIIRLRVEYTAPSGGEYKVEQNQRFSNEYIGKVANTTDVIQFHRKRTATTRKLGQPDLPDEEVLEQMSIDKIKVAELVREYLTAQSLTVLPQNLFSDAVTQYVDKDDKKAMDLFVTDSLKVQVDQMIGGDEDDDSDDEDKIANMMLAIKAQQEERFQRGEIKRRKGTRRKTKPKPSDWDSEMEGHWSDNPAALADDDKASKQDDSEEDEEATTRSSTTGRGRGRGRAGRAAGAGTTRQTAAASKAAAKKPATSRSKKKQAEMEEEEDDDDVVMLDDDDDNDSGGLFVSQASSVPSRKAPARTTNTRAAASTPRSTATSASARQSTLNFSTNPTSSRGSTGKTTAAKPTPARRREPSDDEISDDDAFEPPAPSARATRRR